MQRDDNSASEYPSEEGGYMFCDKHGNFYAVLLKDAPYRHKDTLTCYVLKMNINDYFPLFCMRLDDFLDEYKGSWFPYNPSDFTMEGK